MCYFEKEMIKEGVKLNKARTARWARERAAWWKKVNAARQAIINNRKKLTANNPNWYADYKRKEDKRCAKSKVC